MIHFRLKYLFLSASLGLASSFLHSMDDPFEAIKAQEAAQPKTVHIDSLRAFFIHANAQLFEEAQEFLDKASARAIEISRDTTGKSPTYDTVLHVAIRLKRQDWIDTLINYTLLLNVTNRVGDSPLDLAIQEQNILLIQKLMSAGSKVTRNTVRHALKCAQIQILALIVRDPKTFAPDLEALSKKVTPWLLFESAACPSLQGLRYALETYGTRDINFQEKTGYKQTALHCAVRAGSKDCVQLLLQHGANPLLVDSYNKTPLQDAQALMQSPSATLVLKEGESRQDYYQPIIQSLSEAEGKWRADMVETKSPSSSLGTTSFDNFFLFFEQKAYLEASDIFDKASRESIVNACNPVNGNTVLHTAIAHKHPYWFNRCRQYKELLNVVNNEQDTPLDLALRVSYLEGIEPLLNAGSLISAHTIEIALLYSGPSDIQRIFGAQSSFDQELKDLMARPGWLLCKCARFGNIAGIKYVLGEEGSRNINSPDIDDITPLEFAVWAGHPGCVRTLLAWGAMPIVYDDGETLLDATRRHAQDNAPLLYKPEYLTLEEAHQEIIEVLEEAITKEPIKAVEKVGDVRAQEDNDVEIPASSTEQAYQEIIEVLEKVATKKTVKEVEKADDISEQKDNDVEIPASSTQTTIGQADQSGKKTLTHNAPTTLTHIPSQNPHVPASIMRASWYRMGGVLVVAAAGVAVYWKHVQSKQEKQEPAPEKDSTKIEEQVLL